MMIQYRRERSFIFLIWERLCCACAVPLVLYAITDSLMNIDTSQALLYYINIAHSLLLLWLPYWEPANTKNDLLLPCGWLWFWLVEHHLFQPVLQPHPTPITGVEWVESTKLRNYHRSFSLKVQAAILWWWKVKWNSHNWNCIFRVSRIQFFGRESLAVDTKSCHRRASAMTKICLQTNSSPLLK